MMRDARTERGADAGTVVGRARRSPSAGAPAGAHGSGRRLLTASAYVADPVRDGILRGRYRLGELLDQQVLAEELGVSIIPVREALHRLAADGLVRILPRRGAFVAELTRQELT